MRFAYGCKGSYAIENAAFACTSTRRGDEENRHLAYLLIIIKTQTYISFFFDEKQSKDGRKNFFVEKVKHPRKMAIFLST